ncbi:MAG TPA: diguanylate cyclase [Guyparkeria sp.]|nr:diguanylate cyclase [Guyparkeria sp.]
MTSIDSYKRLIVLRSTVVAVFGGLVFLLLVWSHLESYQSLLETSGDQALERLAVEYQLMESHQEQLARQIFEDQIDQPEVLRLVAQAARTDDAELLAELRTQLYQQLLPLYERMGEKGFRQLHFHLPGAVSFLRFHRPERFGDNLWAVRPGIARVHTIQEAVGGFEEGRVFNGFRNIFPLFHEGQFIGSLEASYSFHFFLLSHAQGNHGGYRLLVSRDLVVDKVWDEERQANYMDSLMHPDFVIDRDADLSQLTDSLPMARTWDQDRLAAIGRAIAPQVKGRMDAGEAFSLVTRHPEPVEISFLPIKTTERLKGGYLLRYAAAPRIAEAWSWLWIKIVLTGVLVFLTISSMVYLGWRESERTRERELWLETLNEAQRIASVGNWAFDVESGVLTWSDEIYRIFGYPPGSFVPTYERFMEMTHPKDRERVGKMVQGVLKRGEAYGIEHRILRSDGEVRYVRERGTVERDAKGRQRLLGTMQEITDHILATEESRQAAAILESAHEGVLIADKDGCIQSVNPAVEQLLGVDESQLLGRQVDDLILDREETTPFDVVQAELRSRGRWEGELWLRRFVDDTNGFPARASFISIACDLGEPRFAVMFSDISDAKAREWAMWHQANHDALTGLANRTLFRERLERAVSSAERHGELVGLLYLDLDDFKPINDNHGHEVGDVLLTEVARRMEAVTRDEDTVSRLGGDEFVVLVSRPATEQALEQVAQKIRDVIEAPVAIGAITIHPRASIGKALYPASGDTTGALINAADEDMYRQKQARKARQDDEADPAG